MTELENETSCHRLTCLLQIACAWQQGRNYGEPLNDGEWEGERNRMVHDLWKERDLKK